MENSSECCWVDFKFQNDKQNIRGCRSKDAFVNMIRRVVNPYEYPDIKELNSLLDLDSGVDLQKNPCAFFNSTSEFNTKYFNNFTDCQCA